MKRLTTSITILASLQTLTVGSAFAYEQSPIQFAGFNVVPKVTLTESYTDNLLQDADNEINTWLTHLKPEVLLDKQYGLDRYSLSYGLSHKNYSAKGRDTITDHKFGAGATFDLGTRHRIATYAKYALLHEERGRDFSIGYGDQLKEPTPYDTLNASLKYTFGARTAQANLDFFTSYYDIEYDSVYFDELNIDEDDNIPPPDENFDVTADRNHDKIKFGSTLRYKLGAFTDVSVTLAFANTAYETNRMFEPSLDNDEFSVSSRFAWQGTAMTTGYVDLGYSEKSFDADERDNGDGIRWKVGVIWKPLTYSNFDFSTARDVTEPEGQGSYIENTNVNLSWHHNWLERLGTRLKASYSEDEYGDTDREDDNNIYSASVLYEMRRNLNFTLSLSNYERDSNYNNLDYTENRASLSVSYHL
ncbi:outer membrane beta-barrel protein [Thalassotalea sp. HSM 43]|uniref:outer membrane beta-barrel protein n=1 Tax=Thalassotalea sp. HSM 43 TaxID=2552945 RepID=UPI00167BDE8B|nr:outer membrane beta-barrel protein [Thalassotalea sp. HSM 43]